MVIVSRTARAAAALMAFPPNVDPCEPGANAGTPGWSSRIIAPIGSPPPKPLANVMMSGRIPSCSGA